MPTDAEAHGNRGNVLLALKRAADALASYDRAIALRPDDADTFYNRGSALLELGRFEEAVASYDQALALRPDHAQAHCNRGNALWRWSAPRRRWRATTGRSRLRRTMPPPTTTAATR